MRWLLIDKFESWRYAPQVTAPTLLLAAEHDTVIARWSTGRLLAHFTPGVARMQVIAGADRNNILHAPDYARAMKALTLR